jgi:hypothetical protein
MDEIDRQINLEDARLAHYPTLLVEAAQTLLTNRALATALIQLHTNHNRYAELCNFLDRQIAGLVEKAARFEWKDLAEDDSDDYLDDELSEWVGGPAECVGHTQKGKPCNKPGRLAHDGQPFCSMHYPYPKSYYERRDRRERSWSEYGKQRRELLERYMELERTVSGLSDMRWELSRALSALGIHEPDARLQENPAPVERTVHVDGLPFEFTLSGSGGNEHHVRRPSGSNFGIIQRAQDHQWAAYVFDPNTPGLHASLGGFVAPEEEEVIRYAYMIDAFYRVRRRRELSWYGTAVGKLARIAGILTTPQPLMELCGIKKPGSGWRVFGFSAREWRSIYQGDSEAEARWNFDLTQQSTNPVKLLVDPAHQIIDFDADSRSMW